MSAAPESTLADLRQTIDDLQRQLSERTAERDEALAEQAAMAEIVQITNRSPGDLTPVFEAILEKAHTLCGATCGTLLVRTDQRFRALTTLGYPPALAERLRQGVRPGANHPIRRLVDGDGFVHVADLAEIDDPTTRSVVELACVRTSLFVPLRRDGDLLGVITAGRVEVRPFSDKEIALLENFAAQAVIAMENARLLTQTRETLEQQTATAEVLQVINSSPGDLAPIFQAIVEKAHALCGAAYGSMQLWDGEKFRGVAMRGFTEPMVKALREGYIPGPNMPCRRLIDGENLAHCLDLAEVDDPAAQRLASVLATRTILYVALRKDDVLLGQIVAARREVRPFAEKEIALVENFAAQAVIAMENARLLTETRESLEQQTATAAVLRVISGSPTNLQPTLDAIAANAAILTGAANGAVSRFDGSLIRPGAFYGWTAEELEAVQRDYPRPPGWRVPPGAQS